MHDKIGFFPEDACKKAVHMNGTYCMKELAVSPIPAPAKEMAHWVVCEMRNSPSKESAFDASSLWEEMHDTIGFFPADACKKAVHMDGTYCMEELALLPIPAPGEKMTH